MDLETEGKHNITLQFGQDETTEINIAFVDSRYNSGANNYNCLCMNLTRTNEGGWESSYMRNNICPQFLELLSSDLQNIIKETTKYTDNIGNLSGNIESNITATKDKIFLLNEYEVINSTLLSNTYEANYTEPYSEIYSNETRKYQHSNSNSGCDWWTRSPGQNYDTSFCVVLNGQNKSVSSGGAYSSRGFSPAFTIY